MGAGASTTGLPGLHEEPHAELAELANFALPASQATPAAKEVALQLKMALSTQEGWLELQELFKALRSNLDDAVTSEEWSNVFQDEELRIRYFGDATPEMIAEQFHRLDENGDTQLTWEEFVDGVISLGAATTLVEELSTVEGEEELKELFDTLPIDETGRVWLGDWAGALMSNPDVLAHFTGLDADTSPRFQAFFLTGRFNVWVGKVFRRLGLGEDDMVTWDEFRAGSRATGV